MIPTETRPLGTASPAEGKVDAPPKGLVSEDFSRLGNPPSRYGWFIRGAEPTSHSPLGRLSSSSSSISIELWCLTALCFLESLAVQAWRWPVRMVMAGALNGDEWMFGW